MFCCGPSRKETASLESSGEIYTPVFSNELKLVQVQILFRHGARTPINFIKGIQQATYPKELEEDLPETVFQYSVVRGSDGVEADESNIEADIRNVKLQGGCVASVLTTVGQSQMYELGKKIRDGYFNSFNIACFKKEDFRLRTTHLMRTIKSLRCMLAGMFGKDHLNEVGRINFTVKSIIEEDLFPNKLTCPALRLATDLILTKLNSIPSYREDKMKVLNALNLPANEPLDFASVRDDIVCRAAHGIPPPPQLVPLLDVIEHNSARTLYAVYSGKVGESERCSVLDPSNDVTRLAIGRLVHTILTQMEQRANGHSQVKIFLYSAHDTSLTPMMEALGIWAFEWPPFAANIIFEMYLREKDSVFFVRVLYCGQPRVIRESSSFLTTLNDFRRVLQKYRLPHFLYSRACLAQYIMANP